MNNHFDIHTDIIESTGNSRFVSMSIKFVLFLKDISINDFIINLQEELVTRLGKKLVVLTNEQTMLVDESTANDVLGNDVALKVAQKVRPGDSTKFRSYVDDVGYITMLLLSLSGRLARTENALHSIGEKTADKVRIINS